jgi:LPXTG-site transpeptidase (sortase) family protein
VNSYGRSASVSLSLVGQLPATGFAPGVITGLPAQPADMAYNAMSGVRLEIPSLGLNLLVTGIPLNAQGWDLTWLANQAGYLEGTAYPGQEGNTAITAHIYTADGNPGPFINLHQLSWGQQVILHSNGYRYIYEVRQNRLLNPNNVSVLYRNDSYTWLTLITCKGFNDRTGSYAYRVAVRAVLVKVEPER